MAKTSRPTKSTPRARTSVSRQRVRRQPPRRVAWFRRPAIWASAVAIIAVVGAVWFTGRGDPSSTSKPFVGGDLHSLAVDPRNLSTLFVGGHEGVAVSADGGRTWRQIETLEGADAMGWAFSQGKVLVGGHPGLFVSEDGGKTFRQQNDGLPATDIHSLGAGDGTIYASSPQAGFFASSDGGRSWRVLTQQVGQSFMGPILVDPEDPKHLVASDMQAGLTESVDGGRTWRGRGGVSGAMWVSWNPENTKHIVLSAMGGVVRSTDGGQKWTPIDVPSGVSVVEMHPQDPQTMYAAGLEGTTATIWVSRDGGENWRRT